MCTVLNTNTYMYIKILKIAIHVNRHVMTLRVLTRFFHSPQYIKVIHYITKPQWFIDKHLCCFTRSHPIIIYWLINYPTLQDGSNIMVDFSSTARAAPICALCLSLFKSYRQKLTQNVLKKFINVNVYIQCQWGKGSSEPKCLLSKIVYLVLLMFF